jgi:hypothetical protein
MAYHYFSIRELSWRPQMKSFLKTSLALIAAAFCCLFALGSGALSMMETPNILGSSPGNSKSVKPPEMDRQVPIEYDFNHMSKWNKQGWARSWNGEIVSGSYGPMVTTSDVAVSKTGHIYVTGWFLGKVDFDPSPDSQAIVEYPAGYNLFLSKFDSSGNLIWVKTWPVQIENYVEDLDNRVQARSIAADSMGNVYLTGDFGFRMDFDPDPSTEQIFGPDLYSLPDAFLLKLDPTGKLLWVKVKGSPQGEDHGWDIAVDGSNNVFWAGADSNEKKESLVFLEKLDKDGNSTWIRERERSGDHKKSLVETDNTGNAYFANYMGAETDISCGQKPEQGTVSAGWGNDGCNLSKWTSDGKFMWCSTWQSDKEDFIEGLAVDSNTFSVYVAGTVLGGAGIDFAGHESPTESIDGSGGNKGYIATYGTYNGAFHRLIPVIGSADVSCAGLAIDSTGNLYTMGHFDVTANVGGKDLAEEGRASWYAAKISPKGDAIWTNVLSSDDSIELRGIAVDPGCGAYLTGLFQGTVNFSPMGTEEHTVAGGKYGSFLVSYPENGIWGRMIIKPGMPLGIAR